MAQMTSTRPESISLDHLLDEHVRDTEGRDIGQVEDLILDASSGTIDFAIVKFGGFLGVGGTYHLIPWPKLMVDTERRTFRMNVTKEQVDRAPSFDKRHVPRTDDREYLDSVYQYWGIDRSQQHERLSEVAYGEQQATVGGTQARSSAPDYETSGSDAYGNQQDTYTTGRSYSGDPTSTSPSTYGGAGGADESHSEERTYGQQPQGYSGQQTFAEQTGVTGSDERSSYGDTGQSGYQPSQQPQAGGWIGSGSGSESGSSDPASFGRSASTVSYGHGEYGPERREGAVHSTWSGSERRAGW